MKDKIHCLPKDFLERLRRIIPSHKWDAILNTFAEKKPTTFRVNTLKTDRFIIKEKLNDAGLRTESVPWYPDAFILKEGGLRNLQETEIYKKGEIYVQSLESMLPPLVLNPQSGEYILDLTAAPGSKTTQMSCLMKGEGKIIANDNNKIRFYRLKANLEMQGAINVEATLRYGEVFGREYPERFDKVLLDAPCSAEGRFDTHAPKSYQFWKPYKVHEMARKQKKLMYSALLALKPRGTLIYSTCTFAPEENEMILNWALEKFSNIEIRKIDFPIPNPIAALGSWEDESFNPWVRRGIRVLPNHQMGAFFIACLYKMS